MSTNVKIILDTRHEKSDNTYPLVLRIIHFRKSTSIHLGYSLKETDWDEAKSEVKKSYTGVTNVSRLNKWIHKQKIQAMDIINKLQDSGEIGKMSVVDLKNRIVNKRSEETFFRFTENLIEELKSAGRIGYAQSVYSILHLVKKFRNDRDFTFEELNYSFLSRFENHCLGRKNTINTIAVYMKTIKMIYNRAIKAGVVGREYYPFVSYTIRTTKTRKRAVPRNIIALIEGLELKPNSRIWHARNYFLFSFYTMGINFADIAHLKMSSIVEERLEYKRQKTKKDYSIKITPQMKEILNLYTAGKQPNEYIFPIINRKDSPELAHRDLREKRRLYNQKLKEIAKKLEIETNLTSYVARHSWATIAKHKGVPIAAISEGMGHEDVKTTETYLDSFDREVLDNFNEIIIT